MRQIGFWITIPLLAAATLAAQEITGSLYGTVTDPAGAAIAGARITATSAERGNVRQSASNEKGEWVLTQVPIGTYEIKVEAPGFKTFDRQAIALGSEDNVKIDSKLEIGASSESITVTAEAPQVDSRTATLGATIGEKMLTDMPLDGRNIFDLTTLMPGVTSVSDPQTFTNDRQGPTFSTSGSRSAQNNMTFDGTLFVALFRNTGLNYPPPDAIQEVRIQTSNYTAEYGRNSGTSMNVVTKSGTNQLHGSAWEFTRNSAFNARTFFAKTVNKLVQNQYGGTLGGPIIKNKLFTSASPALLVNEDVDLSDTVSWVRGAHSFKAGIEYLRLQYLNRTWFQSQGGFTFSGQITGNSAADFLLGLPESLVISTPQLEQGGIQHNLSSYFEDDWRVSPRLTLNLGLRYELPFPWYQPNNYWGSFIPGEQSQIYKTAPTSLVFPGDPNVPRGLVPTDANNFAPRFGFAFDPKGDGKTAIRGGFGVFYDAISANIIQNGTQPFRYTYNINAPYSLTDPLHGYPPLISSINLANPTFSTVPPPSIEYPSPNLGTPYTMQYNLTVQRQVVKDTVLEVAYVGKLGRKLLTAISTNPAIYGPGATLANEDSRRLYPGFSSLTEMGTFGVSEYNALQVRANKRYSRHLMVQGAYTFSKSMDNSSSNVTDTASIPNPFNLQGQWALSDFYAKHIASIAGSYDLPALANRNVFLREGFGGWNLVGRFTAHSGAPVNIVTGADNALSGTPQQRPNVNGSPMFSGSRTTAQELAAWFSPAVFSIPATGTYGNLGRNAIIGPGMQSTNVAILKNFPLPVREGMYLQLRVEAFSLTNTPIFGNPNGTLGASLGKITSASGDRHLQFALKLVF